MLSKMQTGLGTLVVAALLGSASPAAAATCNSTSCSGTIELLYAAPTTGEEQAYVRLDGWIQGMTCAPVTTFNYFKMSLDTEVRRATWQLLLAAYNAKKPVTIALSAAGPCEIQYVTVAS